MLTFVLKSPEKRAAKLPSSASPGGKGMSAHVEKRLKFSGGFYKLSSGVHREDTAVEQCD